MPDTAAHVFGTFFKKVQRERFEENTSEQLRLRTAVEFYDEQKRVFGWCGSKTPSATLLLVPLPKEGQFSPSAVIWADRPRPYSACHGRTHRFARTVVVVANQPCVVGFSFYPIILCVK